MIICVIYIETIINMGRSSLVELAEATKKVIDYQEIAPSCGTCGSFKIVAAVLKDKAVCSYSNLCMFETSRNSYCNKYNLKYDNDEQH